MNFYVNKYLTYFSSTVSQFKLSQFKLSLLKVAINYSPAVTAQRTQKL